MTFFESVAKSRIYRIVIVQFIATFLAATLCLPLDRVIAYSVLLGGLTCAVPNAYMAWRVRRESVNPGLALSNFIWGELGKYALTIMMFVSVYLWVKPFEAGYFFAALGVGLLFNLLTPLIDALRAQVSH